MALEPPAPSGSLPPRTRLLQNLSTQSHLLDQIFNSLTTQSTSTSQLPNLYELLNETTLDLLKLRKVVEKHQEVWTRIEEKKRNVVDLERRARGMMRTLEKERGELEIMVKEGKEIMTGVDKVSKNPIKIPTLLAHAHALAKHSSAPLSSLLTSIDKAQYQPWPTENAMRQGLLFQMEGSMSGVGQTGEIGDESKDVIMAEAQTQAAPQIHREEHGRKYDPDAVFTLDLNSDSDDD